MAERSSGLALLRVSCPRCHVGKLFSYSALSLSKFDDMPAACSGCGQAFGPEVGFYWGALYSSYGFSTGIVVVVGMLLYFLEHAQTCGCT